MSRVEKDVRPEFKMRCNIFLLVLMFGLCYYNVLGQDSSESNSFESSDDSSVPKEVSGNSSGFSEYSSGDSIGSSGDTDDSHDSDANNNAAGYNGGEVDFYYPCENPQNIICVRNFFRTTRQCVVMLFTDMQPVYRQRQVAFMPKVNVTMITNRDVITFFESRIEKLYVNPITTNLVMTISFKSIRLTSGRATFLIHQRGKEPIIEEDSLNASFRTTLTAVIPFGDRIDLRKTSVYAYLHANTTLQMGSRLANSLNPVVASTVAAISSNMDTVVSEVLLTEGFNFFLAFLQSHICHFGVPLSVYE